MGKRSIFHDDLEIYCPGCHWYTTKAQTDIQIGLGEETGHFRIICNNCGTLMLTVPFSPSEYLEQTNIDMVLNSVKLMVQNVNTDAECETIQRGLEMVINGYSKEDYREFTELRQQMSP